MLAQAQARARGYPKAAPNVEPDAGWEGDPTEGNEDLARVIQARQASCLTTFGMKNARARRVWCDDSPAMEKLLQADALLGRDGEFPALKPAGVLREVSAETFTQRELFERFRLAVDQRIDEAIWMAEIGVSVGPDASLFERRDGSSKMNKRGRGQWIEFLADTLIDPAEVRLVDAPPNAPSELRLLGGYRFGRDELFTMLVFKLAGQWRGWSAYQMHANVMGSYRRSSSLVWMRK